MEERSGKVLMGLRWAMNPTTGHEDVNWCYTCYMRLLCPAQSLLVIVLSICTFGRQIPALCQCALSSGLPASQLQTANCYAAIVVNDQLYIDGGELRQLSQEDSRVIVTIRKYSYMLHAIHLLCGHHRSSWSLT